MYLIPLFGILIGWLTVKIIFWLIISRIIPNNQRLIQQEIINIVLNDWNPETIIVEKVKKINLESEIGSLMDKKLDFFVENVASKIPFGQAVLSGPLIDKLKDKVKRELFQSLPELQENLANRVKTDFNVRALIEDKVNAMDIGGIAKSLFKQSSLKMKLEGIGVLIGLVLSLIQLIILLGLGY